MFFLNKVNVISINNENLKGSVTVINLENGHLETEKVMEMWSFGKW